MASKINFGISTIANALTFGLIGIQQKQTRNQLDKIIYNQLVNHQAVVFNTHSNEDYIKKGYQGNAEVYTIVNLIVKKASIAPCYLYVDKGETKALKYARFKQYKTTADTSKHVLSTLYVRKALEFANDSNSLAKLIDRPNDHQSWAELMEMFRIFYFTQGEAFLYRETPIEETDCAVSLHACPANLMEPIFGGDYNDVITHWTLRNFYGTENTIEAKDVFHLKMANPNFDQFGSQLRGQSPLMAGLKYFVQSEEGIKSWANSIANEGVKGIVSPNHADPKLWLTKEQAEVARESMDKTVNGNINNGKVTISAMPLQYSAIGLSPAALNIIEGLKYAGVKLCSLWGVPPVLFIEDPTYANKREALKEFVTNVILPYLNKEESALNRWLVEPFIRRDKTPYVLDYDTSQYEELQPTKDDIEAFKAFCTVNEIRVMQGFDEIENEYANELFIDSGKVPLSDFNMSIDSFSNEG